MPGRAVALAVGAVLVLAACGGNVPVALETPVVSATHSPAASPTPSATPRHTPDKPMPVPDPIAEITQRNKLYAAGPVGVVPCEISTATALRSKGKLVKYARLLVACMQRVWLPLVQRSDSTGVPVQVAPFSLGKGPDSPLCDDESADSEAYYWNKVICLDRFVFSDDPEANLIYLQEVIAHEFGHHLQLSVGILLSYDMRSYESAQERLEDERRLELQASCFGAAFLGANRRTFGLTGQRLEEWRYVVSHLGDENDPKHARDHGSRKNHAYWSNRAFASGNPASCNTFTAPAKRVS